MTTPDNGCNALSFIDRLALPFLVLRVIFPFLVFCLSLFMHVGGETDMLKKELARRTRSETPTSEDRAISRLQQLGQSYG